jgi:predicted esterase
MNEPTSIAEPESQDPDDTGFEQKDGTARFSVLVPVELHRPTLPADGSLLVALHGMGMSPATFRKRVLPLAPPGYTVLIPQGPLPYEMRSESGIRQGNAWYIYLGDERAFIESMQATEEWLLGMIDRYVEFHGLDPTAVSLMGFSQGAYLAGYVAIRNAHRFRRLVVAGGRIKHEVLLDDATRAAAERPDFEILCVHGEEDGSVALDAVRSSVEAVAERGIPTELRTYPTGHSVLDHAQCRDDVKAFLVGALS